VPTPLTRRFFLLGWGDNNKKGRDMQNEKIAAILGGSLGVVFVIGAAVYGIASAWIGWHGIEHHLGAFWAWTAVVFSGFGFFLPLSIGTFFGLTDVYGWGTLSAAIFAFPGVLLWVLVVLATMGKGR
jgi:hypothetical protein